jgi:hypothetical protein
MRLVVARLFCLVLWGFAVVPASAQADASQLGDALERVYGQWRSALMTRNVAVWQAVTASHRQGQVRNRLISERGDYPAGVFKLPAAPPPLTGLKRVRASQNGPTAKLVYFGKVDFAVGGEPTDNLYVVSFLQEGTAWKYDSADFVSLAALPAERAALAAGKHAYLDETADFQPDGEVPAVPPLVAAPKFLAKVYIYSPGRDVRVQVNKLSRHRVVNNREADIIIGGVKDGINEVQWTITPLTGATGKEAMTIRVYLLSEVEGVQPVKAFEYQVDEGQQPRPSGTLSFTVEPNMVKTLMGH